MNRDDILIDWRRLYSSLDEGGDPMSCAAIAEDWIELRAFEAGKLYGTLQLEIDRNNGVGCKTITLYHMRSPVAVATVFRSPLNRSYLVRWVATA